MIIWVHDRALMRRDRGLIRPGDEVPKDYFTEAELADLVFRGRVAIRADKLERAPREVQIDKPHMKAAEPVDGPVMEPVMEPVAESKPKRKRGRKKS